MIKNLKKKNNKKEKVAIKFNFRFNSLKMHLNNRKTISYNLDQR